MPSYDYDDEQDRWGAESERISDAIAFHDHELLKDEPDDEPLEDEDEDEGEEVTRYLDKRLDREDFGSDQQRFPSDPEEPYDA